MYIPNDNNMLLSMINMKLRDSYSTLENLCENEDLDINEITSRMNSINYHYDKISNQFI